jgi:uncharacterized damage-inducible protein DinB
MADLHSLLSSALIERYTSNAKTIRTLAARIPEDEFWKKPYPYGNSFGHLVLHLTGNLNYYVGAQIAGTGYVRDRPKEFADPTPPSKEEALKRFDEAVEMAVRTIKAQNAEDWSKDYSATGADSKRRLEILIHCAAHIQHHIGQMTYLTDEWNKQGK